MRVILEFRNGDGHFLKLVEPETLVPVENESDVAALEQAFCETLAFHLGRREAVMKMLSQRKPPGHD